MDINTFLFNSEFGCQLVCLNCNANYCLQIPFYVHHGTVLDQFIDPITSKAKEVVFKAHGLVFGMCIIDCLFTLFKNMYLNYMYLNNSYLLLINSVVVKLFVEVV